MTGPAKPRRIHPILLILAVVLGAVWFWSAAIRGNLSPKNFGTVDQGRVYRSGQLTPSAMRRVVEKHKIKTVIDLGSYWDGPRLAEPEGERLNQRVADAMGVTRYVMPLYGDGTGNANWYIHALRIMTDPRNQPVLVHCGAGSERTSCASILYDQLRNQSTIEEGIATARTFRHNPDRNPHVTEVLRTLGPEILSHVKDGGMLSDPRFPAIPAPRPVTNPDGATEATAAAPGR